MEFISVRFERALSTLAVSVLKIQTYFKNLLGSCDAFRRLVKCKGRDVLYIGDHIFGDVLRSKKKSGWKTYLVVPELERELTVWTEKRALFEKLRELDSLMASLYKDMDNSSTGKPEINEITNKIRNVTYEMDQEYGVIGSLFRSGSRPTFFANQVERYADLYAHSCYNLVHYPSFYFFRSPMSMMSHEQTVQHSATMMRNQRQPSFDVQESVGQQGMQNLNSLHSKCPIFSSSMEQNDAKVRNLLLRRRRGRQSLIKL